MLQKKSDDNLLSFKLGNNDKNQKNIPSSAKKEKGRRILSRRLIQAFFAVLLIYNGAQVVQEVITALEGISHIVQLTYIDTKENDQSNIRHPYYTICPILNKMADLNHPGATLVSVMLENSFYHPLVHYMSIFNPIK